MTLKVAILGTRGIPNFHGGFEQFTEYFSVFLASKGHEVYVYNSSLHPYTEKTFKGVNIIHCKDNENKLGTVGQFFYDLNCIKDSRKRNFDVILQLGYTSSSIWCKFLPKKAVIITNMDGLEWKRSKYKKPVQLFLKYAEKLAVKSSDFLVSDSLGIQKYIKDKYKMDSTYIAYGSDIFDKPNASLIKEYNVSPGNYNMLIARLEPENNIEIILDGVSQSKNKTPFLVIGKHDVNSFGKYLKQKYINDTNIIFVGGVYNLEVLNNLRYFSNLYFHGHSVGGTNPSLLEAMASNTLIIAHDNIFNQSVLEKNAFYFKDKNDIMTYIETKNKADYTNYVDGVKKRVLDDFSWAKINQQYLDLILKSIKH